MENAKYNSNKIVMSSLELKCLITTANANHIRGQVPDGAGSPLNTVLPCSRDTSQI